MARTEETKIHLNYGAPEVDKIVERIKRLCAKLRLMTAYDEDYRSTIREIISDFPDSSTITPPFHCDYGNITIGEHVFINYNCVFLDTAPIRIGNHTLIGPNCQIYTPQHPFDPIERRQPKEDGYPVVIGDDCWLGGNVTICPGVSIGDRCIVAAGSVVTRSFPADTLIAGNPATAKRTLNRNKK